jgi:hypothetical protein
VSVVEAQLAGQLASSLSLRVEVTAAGHRRDLTVSAGGRGSVSASATTVDLGRTILGAVAILLVGLAGLTWRRGRHARSRRGRHRRRASTARRGATRT